MILVTGGTGLLGSHLLLELVKSGNAVRAVRHRPGREHMVRKIFAYYTADPDDLFSRIEWVDADLQDFGAMEDALKGVQQVFHAGAVVSYYPKDHKAMMTVNVEGTANLINLSLEAGVKKFCYVSSVATLGRSENTGISDEETYWVPSRKNTVYSQSKYGAEREVWRGMEEGLPAVIVNPSVILGPGYWNDNSGFFRLVHEGLKYYTRGVNGFVDVRDVVRAMVGVMDGNHFRERFVVSDANLSYQEFFELIARYLKMPAPSVHVPPALSGLAWRVESVRSFITGSKPEITREMAITTSQVYRYSSEKIQNRLGFTFTPVEQSIREICEHYLADLRQQ